MLRDRAAPVDLFALVPVTGQQSQLECVVDNEVDVRAGFCQMTAVSPGTAIEIPGELDPGVVEGGPAQHRRLVLLSPAQREVPVLERYPELSALPNCDWQHLSVHTAFSVLFGDSARDYARLELAALAGVPTSAGVSAMHVKELGIAVRRVLNLVQQRFGITGPRTITPHVWEAWGGDTDLMRTLTDRVGKYAAAVNVHLADYCERLGRRRPGAC